MLKKFPPGRPTVFARSRALARSFIIAIAISLALAAPTIQAGLVNFFSPTRYVTVSGLAGDVDGKMTYSDARNANELEVFDDTATGSAAWVSPTHPPGQSTATSVASQTSSFGLDEFALSQNVSFATGVPSPPGGGQVHAIGETRFQVSFTPLAPVIFQLEITRFLNPGLPGEYSEIFRLESPSSTIDFALSSTQFSGVFTGALLAGETYTFTAWQRFDSVLPDPLGRDGDSQTTLQMTFVSVPEPDALACLFVGAMTLALLLRRRPFAS